MVSCVFSKKGKTASLTLSCCLCCKISQWCCHFGKQAWLLQQMSRRHSITYFCLMDLFNLAGIIGTAAMEAKRKLCVWASPSCQRRWESICRALAVYPRPVKPCINMEMTQWTLRSPPRGLLSHLPPSYPAAPGRCFNNQNDAERESQWLNLMLWNGEKNHILKLFWMKGD